MRQQLTKLNQPAANQFEKYESAFFSEGIFHVRKPIFKAPENTLSEPEIYTRLIKAMGALDGIDLSELEKAALLLPCIGCWFGGGAINVR